MPWLYGLLIIPIILIIVIFRTLTFKPKDFPEMKKWHEFDEKHAIESLQKMIQFKTVSYRDSSKEDEEEFNKFRLFIQSRYPKIMEVATYEEIERGMLFKIPGTSSEQPVVLMSHYDVVPVQEGWQDDAFSGKLTDTHVYGRGTLDTKSSLNAVMESVEYVLTKGKTFKNDLYLAFSGDEEINGPSANAIAYTLNDRGVKPYLVLDEGGAIVSNMFPGVKEKAAVVGIAEKGFFNLKLTAFSKGGHASTPPKDTPITKLAKVVGRLNRTKRFPLKMTPPVKSLFLALAPHSSSFGIKMLFANLWLFMPIIKLIAKLSGGEFLAMFKTTLAFTIAEGSDAINVLPNEASVGVNIRLSPAEDTSKMSEKLVKIIKSKSIQLNIMDYSPPTTISKTDEAYQLVKRAINVTWPDVVVAPYLMVATTDSRNYHLPHQLFCEHVYKFSPMDVSKADLGKIHGLDEDISIHNVVSGIQFYINLLESL